MGEQVLICWACGVIGFVLGIMWRGLFDGQPDYDSEPHKPNINPPPTHDRPPPPPPPPPRKITHF